MFSYCNDNSFEYRPLFEPTSKNIAPFTNRRLALTSTLREAIP